MYFNSFQFFVFFALFLCGYFLSPRKGKSLLIFLGSLFFYACWDFRFVSLILFSTVVDYVVGLRLHACSDPHNRKRWVSLSLVVNLGLLGIFKYYNFFIDSAVELLTDLGFHATAPGSLTILLPVGISFYTFQTLSYTLDIYRKQLEPTRNFIDFGAFVTFFPQLVAGPIERAAHLLPQIQNPQRPTAAQLRNGTFLLAWGLFEKVVVADNLAFITDKGFAAPASGPNTLLSLYSFAFQVFADFDGYSNMARGMAAIMGFSLFHNFNAPYFAASPSEFWKRWHITLSSWLRDYLYIPLGGNRKGPIRTRLNLMLTMVLGGLWHGAAWTYVLWGTLHGLLLMLWPRKAHPRKWWTGILVRIVFFHLVCLSYLFFRAEDLPMVLELLHSFGQGWSPLVNSDLCTIAVKIFAFSTPVILYQALQYRSGQVDPARAWPLPLRVGFYVILFYAIVLWGVNDAQSFLYFQF
ncbi:MBOAT family O-acyltransferase [Kiritimatiellota bacterium B12222]|nr:MBOAT family O-acyltransferase [Kiritimatiellota bacterium B12222]